MRAGFLTLCYPGFQLAWCQSQCFHMRLCSVFVQLYTRVTWNLRMSRGFPAFFRQFWLHLRKNFRKNLKEMTKESEMGLTAELCLMMTCNHLVINQIKHPSFSPSSVDKYGKTVFAFLKIAQLLRLKSGASASLSSHRLTWVQGSFPTPICH